MRIKMHLFTKTASFMLFFIGFATTQQAIAINKGESSTSFYKDAFLEGNQSFPGKDGYIFLSSELLKVDDKTIDTISYNISSLARIFSEHNTYVVVVIVPTKLSIFPDKILNLPQNTNLNTERYNKIITRLNNLKVNTIDIKKELLKINKNGEYPIWFSKDSHWSSMGSYLIGKYIGEKLNSLDKIPNSAIEISLSNIVRDREDDLYKLLPETVKIFYTPTEKMVIPVTEINNVGLLSEDTPDAIILGSSYSLTEGYTGGIETGLKSRATNFAKGGGGIWGTLDIFMQSKEYKGHSPKLVIWEIPEREFTLVSPIYPEGGIDVKTKTLDIFLKGS